MRTHHELRLALGGYALGTLEPAEVHAVEAHLADCAACLAELDELASVVPALASVSVGELSAPLPSDDLFDRIAGALDAGARPAPRRRRRRLVAVAASVLVLAGAGTAIGLAVSSSTSPATTRASAVAGPVHLAVTATDASSGRTRLELAVRGLPTHERCHLVARAADGTTHDAGTWEASYGGRATVVEATDVARSDLRTLTLYGNGDRKLVAVRL